jgi:spore germination protein KB
LRKTVDEKLGFGEFFTIHLLLIAVKLSDTSPVLLFKRAKNGAWMLPIIAAIVFTPSMLIMLSLLKKYKDKNIIDLTYELMGKFLGFILGIVMSMIMLVFTVIATRDISDEIIVMFYPATPPIVIHCLFMGTALFIVHRGLGPLGSACLIIVPGLILAVGSIIMLSIPDMRFGYFFPVTGIKFTDMIKSIPNYSSMVSEVIFLTILYPSVKSNKDYKIGSILALTGGVLLISVMCLTYLFVFDAVAPQHVPFPFHELTRMIRIGRFISNAEAGYLGLWIIAATLRFSIYLYITTRYFVNTFRSNNLKPYYKFIAAAVIFLGLLPENSVFLIFKGRGYLLLLSFTVFITLPYILWFRSYRRGVGSS